MKFKHLLFIAFGAILALSSCKSNKTVLPYFTDLQNVQNGTFPSDSYVPTIVPDDELVISVFSLNPSATAVYNLPSTNPATKETLASPGAARQLTYVVDSQGYITMPQLGRIHVAGMTTEAVAAMLTERIGKDVDNPVVRVELVNFQVVVAGEVNKPATIRVDRNRFSVLDALSAAGDMTPYGERSRVLVVREENGKKVFTHLDLNNSSTFTSPYFYLKQNDYVYVEPNDVRQANSKYNQDNAYKLTVISTIVSAASVIASLVIALTIK